jgi:hypothetical protein
LATGGEVGAVLWILTKSAPRVSSFDPNAGLTRQFATQISGRFRNFYPVLPKI